MKFLKISTILLIFISVLSCSKDDGNLEAQDDFSPHKLILTSSELANFTIKLIDERNGDSLNDESKVIETFQFNNKKC